MIDAVRYRQESAEGCLKGFTTATMGGSVVGGDAIEESRAREDPLLPGEAADSELPEDAEHWAAVYEELTGILGLIEAPEDTVDRYRRRLEHWRGRHAELSGAAETNELPGEAR